MLQLEKGNIIWFIFNLIGITIKDNNRWREEPFFCNSTIVNRKQLLKYLESINYENDEIRKSIIWGKPIESSVLIVQINGEINDFNKNEIYQKAERISQEIIGFIYTIFLFLTHFQIGITLDFQLSHSSKGFSNIITSKGYISNTIRNFGEEYIIISPENEYHFKYQELINIFNNNLFRFLYNEVKNRSDSFLLDSLVNFYLTSNVTSPITQLLGSITTIEILFENNSEKLSKRIKILLGEEIFDNYNINDSKKNKWMIGVIELRHKIIHTGSICSSFDAYKAIKLAMYCILGYSHIKSIFGCRQSICKHLDLLYQFHYDNDIKLDHFGIRNIWSRFKLLIPKMDLFGIYLLSEYSLCTQEIIQSSVERFSKVLVYYSKYWNLSFEKSYNCIKDLYYYNFDNIIEINVLLEYYNSNKEFIDHLYELSIRKFKNSI
jgi:hypothetical protein